MVSLVGSPNVYTDLAGLQSIARVGRDNTPEGLRQVAKQFESLFINMMLKSMRESSSSLFDDNYLSSNEMKFHQENLDNQLSLHMASVGGIGLADTLYQQMLGRFGGEESSAPVATRSIDAPVRTATRVRVVRPAATEPAMTVRIPARIDSPEEFVSQLLPHAELAAARLGVDPRVLLAQSALETGWGKSIPAHADGGDSHNLFGVKADARWSGEQVGVSTLEYRDGVVRQEKASFRSYQSYADSFSDYVDFLQTNPRYTEALRHAANPEAFARQLQRAGYATDPDYADKITSVMHSPAMEEAVQKANLVKATIQRTSLRHVTLPQGNRTQVN